MNISRLIRRLRGRLNTEHLGQGFMLEWYVDRKGRRVISRTWRDPKYRQWERVPPSLREPSKEEL